MLEKHTAKGREMMTQLPLFHARNAIVLLCTYFKALTKQQGPNVYGDNTEKIVVFLKNFNQLPDEKKIAITITILSASQSKSLYRSRARRCLQ